MSFLKANKKKKDALKFFNAAKNGTVNDIKLFIEKGKLDLVNKRDEDEWTPVFWSCFNGHPEVTKVLINAGAEVGIEDKQGRTPLYLHCGYHGDTEITKLLIKSGSNVLAKNKDGWSTLGSIAPIEILVDAGADLLQVDNTKKTPLELAIVKKHEDIINLFKRLAKNLLFTSVKQGKSSIAHTYLEKFGIDVNIKDLTGWTPLHFAVQHGNELTVKMLLSSGADPSLSNMKGQTPEMLAKDVGNLAMAKLLQTHTQEEIRKNKSDLLMERENQLDILSRKEAIKDQNTLLRKRSSTSSVSSKAIVRKEDVSISNLKLTPLQPFPAIEKPSITIQETQPNDNSQNSSSTVIPVESPANNSISSPKETIHSPNGENKISSALEALKKRQLERKNALLQAKEEALSHLTEEEKGYLESSKKNYKDEELLSPDEIAYFHNDSKDNNNNNSTDLEQATDESNNNNNDNDNNNSFTEIGEKDINISEISETINLNADPTISALQLTKIADSPSPQLPTPTNFQSYRMNTDLEDLLDSLGIDDLSDGETDNKDVFKLLQSSIDSIGEILN